MTYIFDLVALGAVKQEPLKGLHRVVKLHASHVKQEDSLSDRRVVVYIDNLAEHFHVLLIRHSLLLF